MKKTQLFLIIISVLALSLCSLVGVSIAREPAPAAAMLVHVGENLLEENRIDDAIHEFSKAMMLDPQNEQAIYYLNQLGVSHSLYKGYGTGMTSVAEMGQHVLAYQQKMSALEQEKWALEHRFSQMQSERDQLYVSSLKREDKLIDLTAKLANLDSAYQKQGQAHDVQVAQMKDEFSQTQQAYQDMVALDNRANAYRFRDLKEREEQLDYLGDKLFEAQEQALNYEDQLKSLQFDQRFFIRKVSDKMAFQNQQVHVLEDYLHMREDTLSGTEAELFRKQIHLTDNEQRLLNMMNDVRDYVHHYERRINEREDLIVEQNKQITELEQMLFAAQVKIKNLKRN